MKIKDEKCTKPLQKTMNQMDIYLYVIFTLYAIVGHHYAGVWYECAAKSAATSKHKLEVIGMSSKISR